jgi:hypothetical protein
MIRTGTFVSIHALPVNHTVTSPSLSVDNDEESDAHQAPSRFSSRWLRLALSAQGTSGMYGKDATMACNARWRSIRWPRPVRKAAEKGGHRRQFFVRYFPPLS